MSYLSAQPGFLRSSAPAPAPKRNWFSRFVQQQLLAPEHRIGNMSIAWGITVFSAGVLFVRKAGHLITPVF